MKSTFVVLSSLLALSVSACSSEQPPPRTPDTTPPSTSQLSTGATPGSPDAMGSSTTGTSSMSGASAGATGPSSTATPPPSAPATPPVADTSPALTDEQILHVTHTANTGEIEQAKLAQSKAKDPRVKKLAAMMLKDHTDADTKGMTIAKKASLTPAANPTSASLESDAQSTTTSLKGQTGADFDKAYVDAQVKEHQAVLDTIDQKLVPGAKNADVKAFLAEVRPKIAMHLQHARDLQKEMSK